MQYRKILNIKTLAYTPDGEANAMLKILFGRRLVLKSIFIFTGITWKSFNSISCFLYIYSVYALVMKHFYDLFRSTGVSVTIKKPLIF